MIRPSSRTTKTAAITRRATAKAAFAVSAFAAVVFASRAPHARAPSPPAVARDGAPEVPAAAETGARARGGAWVWTRGDADVLERARAAGHDVRGAVHVATIVRHPGGALAWKRALSPDVGRGPLAAAAVIRLDDSVHEAWSDGSAEAVAARLAPLVGEILAQVEATLAPVDEVQLDYDAPVRSLEAWARVVAALTAAPLRGRSVWVTSLPAHLDVEGYGALFAPSGVGHILQVFDTGLPCSPAHALHLAERLASHRMRFRIGVGAFERAGGGAAHACWQAEAAGWRSIPGYAGFWIFPGGRDIQGALALLEGDANGARATAGGDTP